MVGQAKQEWEQVGVEKVELLYHIDVSPQGDCSIRDSFLAVPNWENAFSSKAISGRIRISGTEISHRAYMGTRAKGFIISINDNTRRRVPSPNKYSLLAAASNDNFKVIPDRIFRAASTLFMMPHPQEYQSITIRQSSIHSSFERLPPELQLQILERLQIHDADRQIHIPHLIRLWEPHIQLAALAAPDLET
ncbi:uncharacterized protein PAC_03505 [Phialocephala subalpina]|uniref:Uncharacterized protein n=1 Tax=Phialocephala subalpina TaxID=576137 RepID=A0A1L7WLI4_9HELO|nr:uncharacterized protein PAC_03505 [Phialocephala subalpina]